MIDGKSERGGYDVVRKPMRQWMLKITAYADRLLDDLELVDWPESIKEMQRNWIGRSVGANIEFKWLVRINPIPYLRHDQILYSVQLTRFLHLN